MWMGGLGGKAAGEEMCFLHYQIVFPESPINVSLEIWTNQRTYGLMKSPKHRDEGFSQVLRELNGIIVNLEFEETHFLTPIPGQLPWLFPLPCLLSADSLLPRSLIEFRSLLKSG
jgi:hypothetical protein